MSLNLYIPEPGKIIHKVKVDVNNRNTLTQTLNIVQYDNGLSIVAVHLFNEGIVYSIDNSVEVVLVKWFKVIKKSKEYEILGINENRSIVYFQVNKDMSLIYGLFHFTLELSIIQNGKTIRFGTSKVDVIVDRNPIQNDDDYIDPSITIDGGLFTEDNDLGVLYDGGLFTQEHDGIIVDGGVF